MKMNAFHKKDVGEVSCFSSQLSLFFPSLSPTFSHAPLLPFSSPLINQVRTSKRVASINLDVGPPQTLGLLVRPGLELPGFRTVRYKGYFNLRQL